jgi:hypothetical protein
LNGLYRNRGCLKQSAEENYNLCSAVHDKTNETFYWFVFDEYQLVMFATEVDTAELFLHDSKISCDLTNN